MLGTVLKAVREAAGLNLTEAAERLGMSKAYVSEIENGKKVPTLETLDKYSTEFAIPKSHILFFAENYNEPEGPLSKRIRQSLNRGILALVRRR